jgi:hypothetical protein
MKKTLYTLNLNPDEYGDITEITYPLLKHYAKKIDAEFVEIKDRKFPEWPPTFEKLQVFQLGQEAKNDWNIFFDADAMVHPDTPDYTLFLNRDMCAHNGSDMAAFRFRYDRFFLRDGRNIGSASWLCIASDWTIDLFEPPNDIKPEDVEHMIFPTASELKNGVAPIRLVEDFIMGRNIAKYGLKFTTLKELHVKLGLGDLSLFYHIYATPKDVKITKMKQVLQAWGLTG